MIATQKEMIATQSTAIVTAMKELKKDNTNDLKKVATELKKDNKDKETRLFERFDVNFKGMLEKLVEHIEETNSKLKRLDDHINDVSDQLEDVKQGLTARVETAEQMASNADEKATAANSEYKKLGDRLAALEDGCRRNNIRIEGIPEKRESSSPVKFVVELLSKIIGDDFKLDNEIATAYRTKIPSAFKSRSFIVRFERLRCKLDVMALLRHKQEIIFENNLIRIFPDFSPSTAAKRRSYNDIKRMLREADIKYSLLYPAKLKVEVQDGHYIFFICSHLTGLNAKIVFLQETHLLTKDQFRLQKDWTGQMFHSSFIKKTRGVGILIHRTVPFVASEVVSDPEGRYVMVMGNLYNSKMILINVYAPNVDDKEFMQNLFASIPNVNTHKIIMAGDFNCVLNPLLDRTPVTGGTTSNTAKIITQFLNDHNLSDPWRFLNPNSRTYSFYSPVHYSYSRIDYFFIDNNFLPTIKSCKYDTIVISDHAPLVLELKSISPSYSPRRWRLNPLLLADENCTEFISKQISFFLEKNTSTEVSAGTLWETLKVFLRGQIISYLSHRNKLETKKVSELRNEITRIDEEQARRPSEALHRKRQALHTELNILTTKETEQLIYKSRQHYYEHGEKANKLLAQQIHKQEVHNAIPVITNKNGEEIIDHNKIMHTFRDYYKSLYSTEPKEDNTQSNAFLDNSQIPQIDALSAEELDKPLTLTELLDAIKSLQSGKSSGPDGYPVEFYKKFSTQLAPLLLVTFTEAKDHQILPQTFRQALITVFPKQNKDLLQCASYRPISLLNNDVKILSKILARRMEKVLPSVISQDQTGFIKGRHLSSNLRRLFNVIYSPAKSNTPEILLSLDAEKAFDMIEWNYLFTALEKFGFGPNICAWIKLLYTSPEASVCINKICSDYFKLERGTRQGCPLSPLLFAIAIEPLAVHCRNSHQIKGIVREGLEQKISLYADDMVLYISDPENTAPAVLTALTEFQKISGLRINLNKSILFPVNSQAYNNKLDTLPFTIETNTISAIYKILLESLPFKDPRGHWEEDLLINISEKEWKVAKQRIHSSSICAKHRIIQVKIIYRAHLSRLKLSKMFPGQDPTCERCNQAPASLGHMFWACTKLTSFWTKIFKCLSDSLSITIPPNPLTAVFGVLPDGLELEKDKQTVIAFTTLLARRLILLNWKNPNSPLISQWETDVLYYLKLEKI
uniref:Reverse transcriptase domain-containing protein n=1 Tax=Erpetoichthys calabaricus TaxID=27687 RepID=A0A8C4SC52_ERPCA